VKCSWEYADLPTTIVDAKFGWQTEYIMDNCRSFFKTWMSIVLGISLEGYF